MSRFSPRLFRLRLAGFLLAAAGGFLPSLQAATHTIYINSVSFQPNDLTVKTGDTVVWVIFDGGSHTVTGTGGDVMCGGRVLYPGDTCVRTFNTAGNFPYRCQIHGNFGETGVVRVIQNTNGPPTVSLTSPPNNATFDTNALISVRATAADTNANLSHVEFFRGSTSLGTISNSPFSLTISNVPAGGYALTAVASDVEGLKATSGVVNIRVITPITLSSPAFSNSLFQLLYNSETGVSYVIQGSTNLTNWTSLLTNTTATNPASFIDTNSTNFDFRFYRIVISP